MKIINAILSNRNCQLSLAVLFDCVVGQTTGPYERGLTIQGIWEPEQAAKICLELDPTFDVTKIERHGYERFPG